MLLSVLLVLLVVLLLLRLRLRLLAGNWRWGVLQVGGGGRLWVVVVQ